MFVDPVTVRRWIAKGIKDINTIQENINILLEKLNDRKRKAFKLYLNGKVDDSIYNEEISYYLNCFMYVISSWLWRRKENCPCPN